ncbi:pVI [red squirrel adenovirus 1]|uniref:Pre-protein VI n=1 Tax=red squirrel adenovirus 1 TaxID=2773314 RepID=A0A240FBG3_9ADEN|nr:pVI [red squirrel adenovirus 1]ARE31888.1 pVI [red squirrel adenovirus 1]WUG45429.1 pVI [Squirrel mastadenovirus A]
MEDITFSALAPRRGTRPMLGSEIGTSAMSGGAFNWGSLWSGLKNFGSTIKNFGVKTWNSSTGQALRDKLKDTKVQEKIVDGIAAGVHGALDIARQELDKKIAQRLDNPVPVPLEPTPQVETKPAPTMEPPVAPVNIKRPRDDEEELIIMNEQPPAYDDLYPDKSPPPPLVPTTRPHPSMAKPVLSSEPVKLDEPIPIAPISQPSIFRPMRGHNWQSTLNSIVGLGVRSAKRRRCFY